MDTIKITLETLYDVLLNEKKKEDLQKLEDSFFIDVVSYLREKKNLLESKDNSDNIFSSGEKDKLEYELRSIKRILKEIYEKREKKIIDIALNRSRTGSDIIDTSCMLFEEKEFYEEVLRDMDKYRVGILAHLFRGVLPDITGTRKQVADMPSKVIVSDEDDSASLDEPEKPLEVPEENLTKIKFVNPMPSFVWKDMKVYGPYEKEEVIDIFPEVADLLIRKGRAEKV